MGIWFSGPIQNVCFQVWFRGGKGLSTSLERDWRDLERPSTAFLAIFGDLTLARTPFGLFGVHSCVAKRSQLTAAPLLRFVQQTVNPLLISLVNGVA